MSAGIFLMEESAVYPVRPVPRADVDDRNAARPGPQAGQRRSPCTAGVWSAPATGRVVEAEALGDRNCRRPLDHARRRPHGWFCVRLLLLRQTFASQEGYRLLDQHDVLSRRAAFNDIVY